MRRVELLVPVRHEVRGSGRLADSGLRLVVSSLALYASLAGFCGIKAEETALERVIFNHPGLVVDLGVGLWAWPLPMDYDGDGDWDLVVSCPDKPYNGTYFFERDQPGGLSAREPVTRHDSPVFKPGVRIASGPTNVQVSFVGGRPVVMTPAKLYADFREHQYEHPINLPLPARIDPQYERYRANQWRLVDFDNDGDLDVVIGVELWDDYGWDDAWDESGDWVNGPLHGYVYLVENLAIASQADASAAAADGTFTSLDADQPWPEFLGPRPLFAPAVKIVTPNGEPVDVFGMPSPSFADFDGDGDLDLLCGEFLDGFTYFQNVGTRAQPAFSPGIKLPVKMDLQMITPTAVDWDADGDMDLICGDEDGRVALLRCTGVTGTGTPVFDPPAYFRQEAADVKFGALVTPCSVDWDGDGDEDLICGNTAGSIGFIENLDGGNPPKWAAPVLFRHPVAAFDPLPVRLQAEQRGSIQGPCEAKWGYTTLSVADWNSDGHLDIVTNDIWGKVRWHGNLHGFDPSRWSERQRMTMVQPFHPVTLSADAPQVKPAWVWWEPQQNQLATQWRTTPCAVDWNDDGRIDLVMLDHEGYLAFFERSSLADQSGALPLLAGRRIFKIEGACEFDGRHQPLGDKRDGLLRLNAGWAGKSGRRKLHIVDWDGDGRRDLLVNSVNVNWLRNVRTDEEGFVWFRDEGPLDSRVLAGHDTSPTTVDWDKNGIPDLLVGAEDGRLYYKRNPRATR